RTCQTMIRHCRSFEAPAEFHNPARACCSRVNSCFQRLHFVDQVLYCRASIVTRHIVRGVGAACCGHSECVPPTPNGVRY
ncbi:hypothetical protein BJV82DRAFT_613289, partial [Fennellomyces sp. T-0311]